MAHGLFCKCKKCNPSLTDIFFGSANRGNWSDKKLKDGTRISGPKKFDKPGKANYHGHSGDNFRRSPHSTLGSAATGRAHTYKDHPTHRRNKG
ncbi:hypothetical protein [Nocardia aurea]|uniref:Uncharacterized protein n=1 Tax=Nocardia aurea TaxID=2144174 RepID=A0ABV3G1M9_9NOCA